MIHSLRASLLIMGLSGIFSQIILNKGWFRGYHSFLLTARDKSARIRPLRE
jgi:hypothetical protein